MSNLLHAFLSGLNDKKNAATSDFVPLRVSFPRGEGGERPLFPSLVRFLGREAPARTLRTYWKIEDMQVGRRGLVAGRSRLGPC